MGIRTLSLPVLLVILLFCTLGPVQSLETGELPGSLEEMSSDIDVNLYLWTNYTIDKDQLIDQLPENIIQESLYPRENEIDIWQVNIAGRYYGLNTQLNYNIEVINQSEYHNMVDSIKNSTSQITVNSELVGGSVTGFPISNDLLHTYFDEYQSETAYNIHILDFDNAFQGLDHWINVGKTTSIPSSNLDMRNIYDLGGRQLIFDSSAIAPYFQYFHDDLPTNIDELQNYLVENMTTIIEQIILGSPQSFNLLAIEKEIQVDRIIIAMNSSDIEYSIASGGNSYQAFELEVSRIFSSFDLKQRDIEIPVDAISGLRNFIDGYTQNIGGIPTIIVDNTFAEKLKFEIRDYIYKDFPSRYYYGIFFFADEERRYMVNETTNGVVTNNLIEYNVGEIGFAMDSLKEWYESPLSQLSINFVTSHMMKLLGQNFGLGMLTSNLSRQIDSPMSTYGVSDNWKSRFSQYEVDQLQKRLVMVFTNNVEDRLEKVKGQLDSPVYFWVDQSDLAQTEADLVTIRNLIDMLKYDNALTQVFDIIQFFEQNEEIAERSHNILYYGSFLLVIVILLSYYSKILIEDSITKEDFKHRIEAQRQYHQERNKKVRK